MGNLRPLPPEAKGTSIDPPTVAALLHEEPFIRRRLRRYGVDRADLDDVTQDVLLGAWLAIERGRYEPPPRTHPRRALRAWLHGVCRNLASHYRERACRWREVPCAEVPERPGVDVEGQVMAREALARLASLSPQVRAAVVAAALGDTFAEVGEALGIPASTAAKRVYAGRAALTKAR